MLQLLPHPDLPASQEVDVRDGQPEGLPLPETGPGTDDGERPIPGGQGIEERFDVLRRSGSTFTLDLAGSLMAKQGDRRMRSSLTAMRKMADSHR